MPRRPKTISMQKTPTHVYSLRSSDPQPEAVVISSPNPTSRTSKKKMPTSPTSKKKMKKLEFHDGDVITSFLKYLRSHSQSSSSSRSETLTVADHLSDLGLPSDRNAFCFDDDFDDDDLGFVIGKLVLTLADNRIDLGDNRIDFSVVRTGIPSPYHDLLNINSDALFILLVDDLSVFNRLANDEFYKKFPCIIIMSEKGRPHRRATIFLRRLKIALKIPVLALVDCDPCGLKTLLDYMLGSKEKEMFYDNANLDIKWLGLRPSDLDKHRIPDFCLHPMTKKDVKTGNDLLKEDFVKRNKKWLKELKMMMKVSQKTEVLALSPLGMQYLTKVYLPLKLLEQDWL